MAKETAMYEAAAEAMNGVMYVCRAVNGRNGRIGGCTKIMEAVGEALNTKSVTNIIGIN